MCVCFVRLAGWLVGWSVPLFNRNGCAQRQFISSRACIQREEQTKLYVSLLAKVAKLLVGTLTNG